MSTTTPPSQLRISREQDEGELPRICMVCGGEATDIVPTMLSWHANMIYFGIVANVIAAIVATNRAMLKAPLCAKHKNHWKTRNAGLLFGFLGVIAMAALALSSTRQSWSMFAYLGFAGVASGWVIAALSYTKHVIKPEFISTTEIVLVNVAPAFIDAMVTEETNQENAEQQEQRRQQQMALRNRRFRSG
jgi:hypothetical protein